MTKWQRLSRHTHALLALAVAAAVLCSAQVSLASHYRSGRITWTTAGGNTINFTIENSWRRSGYGCRDATAAGLPSIACTGPGGLPGVGDVIVENIANPDTTFNYGDGSPVAGSSLGGLLYLVTAIDPASDWLIGLALDPASLPGPPTDTMLTHTYATTGNFTAFIDSQARVSASGGHVNNANGQYRLETLVDVGTGNRSPVSSMPPIIQCPINGVCGFTVPGSDPDSDTIRFRLATSAEAGAGFTQPGPTDAPNAASINSSSGAYTWNTTGATLGSPITLYSTQVIVEDLTSPGGSVKSKIPVDFFILLTNIVGVPPVFVHPPTPTCGSTQSVNAGSNISFTVQASDSDALQMVTLNASGLPSGATMTPGLPTSGNPVSSTFSWTPTLVQVGNFVVTFSATDDASLQTLCAITVQVIGATPTPTATATATDTETPTPTDTPTDVPTPTPTDTATNAPTDTPADTPTNTLTPTQTGTPTDTPLPTSTGTHTHTQTPTPTGLGICPLTPVSGCQTPVGFSRPLRIGFKRKITTWRWRTQGNINIADFGNPVAATTYSLCIYAGASPTRIMELQAPFDGTCPVNKPCWKSKGPKGFRYSDKDSTPNGIRRLRLRTTPPALADIVVRARGPNIPFPTLPLASENVVAQLIKSDGPECWQSNYSSPAKKNNADIYLDKND